MNCSDCKVSKLEEFKLLLYQSVRELNDCKFDCNSFQNNNEQYYQLSNKAKHFDLVKKVLRQTKVNLNLINFQS